MRWRCWWLGCREMYGGCTRCGAGFYDIDYIHDGWWPWIVSWLKSPFRLFPLHKCWHCERLFWSRHEGCCAKECDSQWIPF